ncbi:radical SAM protein [Dactylosporangium sp. CS-047395]|uniref:radical SAM protein n=1 Tax=Dactylosporangium sp. CS-047395 TaxID=3239936 RepID=UPI003D8B87FA
MSDDFLDSRTAMSLEMVDGIIKWATDRRIDEITVLGGEPASHRQFADILVAARRHGRTVRTVTNGSRRFQRALADDRVRESLNRVAVSLDSADPAVCDRLRGAGAYADAMATIELLRGCGIPFDINCTVLRSGLDGFERMLPLAEQLGADRLNVHWFSAVGRARRHAVGESVTPAEWHKQVLNVVAEYSSPRPGYVVDCELGYQFGMGGEQPAMCAVQDRTNLQFFPSGAVFGCGLLVEDEERSGYVWRDGALHVRPGRTELAQTEGRCGRCPLRDTADGYEPLCIYNRYVP